MGVVFETFGDHVDDVSITFDHPVNTQQSCAQGLRALFLRHPWPQHQIDVTRLIFQGNKDHAARRRRTLSDDHEPAGANRLTVFEPVTTIPSPFEYTWFPMIRSDVDVD